MLICSCGTRFVPGERFCSACGTPRPAGAVSESTFCQGCGTGLAPGEAFCTGCGRPAGRAPAPHPPVGLYVARRPQIAPSLVIALIAVAAIAAIGVGLATPFGHQMVAKIWRSTPSPAPPKRVADTYVPITQSSHVVRVASATVQLSPPQPVDQPAANDMSSAAQVVDRYYLLWNEKDYAGMYDLLSSSFQSKHPWSQYPHYHSYTESISASTVPGNQPQQVLVRIHSRDHDDRGNVSESDFEGSWNLVYERGGWKMDAEDLHEVTARVQTPTPQAPSQPTPSQQIAQSPTQPQTQTQTVSVNPSASGLSGTWFGNANDDLFGQGSFSLHLASESGGDYTMTFPNQAGAGEGSVAIVEDAGGALRARFVSTIDGCHYRLKATVAPGGRVMNGTYRSGPRCRRSGTFTISRSAGN